MSDYTAFVAVLTRNHVWFSTNPVVVPALTREFIRCAKRMQRYNLLACNVGLTDRQRYLSDQLEIYVKQLCGALGFGYELSGDPRGCPLKLILPDKTTNSFGGVGYCVPMGTN